MIQAVRRKQSPRTTPPTLRVAVYCRQSVEDRTSKFGSLEAQRDAVEAYVASQRGQGWVTLADRYDDSGFSGSNTDRPAFQQLIADIEAGKVDAVGVYRLDRLSRSLLDFATLMAMFQTRGIAFISVTEHFDTATPMGRMVLGMLATFAQFERESIAQRTKDKMLATRQRGMWTGGRPVLGYDVRDKKLVVNKAEADRVRQVFELYLNLGSLLPVVEELARKGWTTKSCANKAGKPMRGFAFSKTSVHGLLTNPLYIGKVRAGDDLCDGLHEAIVDDATWQAVQTQLRANAGVRKPRYRPSKSGALLQGLAWCVCGAALTPHYSSRGSRRWAYYVCSRSMKMGVKACPGSRVAAGELERFVLDQIRCIGRDPKLLDAAVAASEGAIDRDGLRVALEELDPIWDELFPQERARVFVLLIERVEFDAPKGEVAITFRPGAPRGIKQ